LEASYRFKKRDEQVLETLSRSKELVLERAEIVSRALRKFSAFPAAFADCLIGHCGQSGGMQTHRHLRPECHDWCWHAPPGLICLFVQGND
jgi:predicted nucleic-acid-binding protein